MRDKIILLIDDESIKEIKKEQYCYIVAKNGIFYKDKQDFIESVVAKKQIHYLKSLKEYVKWGYPKINKYQFTAILKFFKKVYIKDDAECMVFIGHDREKNKIVIFPPESQIVSKASIKYENPVMPGISIIGTVHSHNSMGAFHSGTDIKDEIDFDGLHITIGKLTKDDDSFEISCQLTSGDYRQDIEYVKVIDGIKKSQKVDVAEDYKNKNILSKLFNNFIFSYNNKNQAINYESKLYSELEFSDLPNKYTNIINQWYSTITVQKFNTGFNNYVKSNLNKYPSFSQNNRKFNQFTDPFYYSSDAYDEFIFDEDDDLELEESNFNQTFDFNMVKK